MAKEAEATSSPKKSGGSRTEELPDETVGAWYTDENDEEQYLGSFKDERTAQFAIGDAEETAKARKEAKEDAEKEAKEAKEAKAAKK